LLPILEENSKRQDEAGASKNAAYEKITGPWLMA